MVFTSFQGSSRRSYMFRSVLFFRRPRSEGWPHHGRTFSVYPCPLSFWLTLPRESCPRLDVVHPGRAIVHAHVIAIITLATFCRVGGKLSPRPAYANRPCSLRVPVDLYGVLPRESAHLFVRGGFRCDLEQVTKMRRYNWHGTGSINWP